LFKKHNENFDKRAGNYVGARRQLYGTKRYYYYVHNKILDRIKPEPGTRILDLFSGHSDLGSLAQQIYKSCTIIAADKFPSMLKFSQLSANVACDALKLPFKSGAFHTIVVCGGLHHLKEDNFPAALKEIFSCLADGGSFVIVEAVDDSPLVSLVRSIFYPIMPTLGNRKVDETILTADFLRCQLSECGFKILYSRYVENLAYTLLGQTGVMTWLSFLSRSKILTRVLLTLDNLIEKLPLAYLVSFGYLIEAKKPVKSPVEEANSIPL
jgi:ubiquinone/menaquinone biosynthesis C-methylase UbiE